MSVDVRGHDTKLDVHGVFSDGCGTCSIYVRAAVVVHVLKVNLMDTNPFGVVVVLRVFGLDGSDVSGRRGTCSFTPRSWRIHAMVVVLAKRYSAVIV